MGLVLSVAAEILAYRDEKGKLIPYCKMNPTVFLTIGEEGGTELGTIAIKLSKKTHPALTDNFVKLCTGEEVDRISGDRLTLSGSSLWSDGTIVGGGELMDTMGRATTPSGFFTQNTPSLPVSKDRCCLAMLPLSLHKFTFTSLFFFVKCGSDRICDGIIFGDVIEGAEVLDAINQSIESKRRSILGGGMSGIEEVNGVKKIAPKDHLKQIVDMQNGHPTLVELWTSSLDDPPPETFQSEKKTFIEMERKSEYNPAMCCHYKMKLQNSEKPVIIYVKTPNSRCFSVTPKIDLIEPNGEKWLFFSYDSRSSSLPDDFTFAFTIYQIEVQNSKLLDTLKKEWETHSRKTLRETWQSHAHRPCTFLLWLPVVFHNKPTKGRSCTKRHADYLPKLLFDTKGHKIKDEEVYDPAKHDENEDDQDLPSAEQDGENGKKIPDGGGEEA